ncbi:MAG: PIN domain-containing protein [Thermoplasmatota archaeon]
MVELVFDTFAWIELLGGGPGGADAEALHISHDVGTPVVVLAEAAHLYARRAPHHLAAALDAIRSTSELLPLTPEIAESAGKTRAAFEGARKGIGLVDCIVLETARAAGVPLVTGDPHLKGLKGVRFLSR